MSAAAVLNAIPAIKYTELQAYLRNTGWERINVGRTDIGLYQKADGTELREVLLPLNRDFADYKERIVDALEQIAAARKTEVLGRLLLI